MGFTNSPQLYGLLLVAIVAVVSGQPKSFRGIRLPNFPSPPNGAASNANRIAAAGGSSPNIPNPLAPPSVRSFLQTYCPLTFTAPFKDPTILDTSAPQLAAARARAESRVNPSQKLYLDGRRQMAAARDARAAADQGRPSVAAGRSKRQSPLADIAVLAPTDKTSVCQAREKVVQSVYTEEDGVCYTFSDDEVRYWECASSFAKFPNTNIKMERFYCESDNYVYQSVLAYCIDTDNVRWVTVHVPISCCSRRYSCDFTPYSSANGPKRFE